MKKSIYRSSIALLLSLLLIMGALPLQVIALGTSTSGSPGTSTPGTSDALGTSGTSDEYIFNSQEFTSDELIGEVAEEISLREENVKHFRLSNGTYQAVVYGSPVHRKDKDGAWQNIDNSLSIRSEGKSKVYATSDSRISFAESYQANEALFTLSENGYAVSLSLSEGLSASKGAVTNPKRKSDTTVFSSLSEAIKIDNRSSILYKNILKNTSIEYVLDGNDVKENIIVYAPCESYIYTFRLSVTGLKAKLDDAGNIRLHDGKTGESVYAIPAPYMYDANGEISKDVSYKLSSLGEGEYTLTVTADKTWINDSERAFPVTIDPSLVLDSGISDAYVDSAHPYDNYGWDDDLWVSDAQTSYFYTSVPAIPSGASLNSAYLYLFYYYPSETSGTLLAGAYQLSQFFIEDELTFEFAPDMDETQLDAVILQASTSISESTPGLAGFEITEAVHHWYDGSPNYGIGIKREESDEHTNDAVVFRSYDAYDEYYPYISINYTSNLPNGVYAIRGANYTSRWMTVENDSVLAGSHLQQMYSTDLPTATAIFDRSSLFKICQVGDTGRFIIRSMLNSNLTLTISGNEVVTKEIPSNDNNVAIEDTFCIEWNGEGYLIYPYGSTRAITMGGVSGTEPSNLSTVSIDYASTGAVWSFVQYTGLHKRGISFSYSDPLIVGTTLTLTPIVWATNIGFNTPRFKVDSGYTDKALLVDGDEDARSSSFALRDHGTLKVTSYVYNNTQTSSRTIATHTFNLKLVVEDGLYVIENKETEKYVQISANSANHYYTSGNHMTLGELDNESHQKWQFIHVGDGYYKILSVTTGLALCVQGGTTGYEGGALVQEPYLNTSRMKWKITQSDSGAYIIKSKISEGADLCAVAVTSANTSSPALCVEQHPYTSDTNFNDEWLVHNYDTALLLSFIDYTDYGQRHLYFDNTKKFLQDSSYGMVSITSTAQYSAKSVPQMINYLKSSDIFMIHTHGLQNGFQISNSGTFLTMSDIAEEDLSNISFALLLTCYTGLCYSESHITNGTPMNILEQMVLCGAETVVGFNSETSVSACNRFAEQITFMLVEQNLSISEAVARLDYQNLFGEDLKLSNVVIAGNGDNTLRN